MNRILGSIGSIFNWGKLYEFINYESPSDKVVAVMHSVRYFFRAIQKFYLTSEQHRIIIISLGFFKKGTDFFRNVSRIFSKFSKDFC